MTTKTEKEVVGRFWREDENPYSIFVTLDDQTLIVYNKVEYGDLYEAIYRWFVDRLGFTTESIKVTDVSDSFNLKLVARLDFVDDGLVMAKIQGII